MEISLLKTPNAALMLNPSLQSSCSGNSYKVKQNVDIVKYLGKDQKGMDLCRKLYEQMHGPDIFKETEHTWILKLTLYFHKEENSSKLDVSVEGGFLSKLQRFIHFGNPEKNLQLSLILEVSMAIPGTGRRVGKRLRSVHSIEANDLQLTPVPTGSEASLNRHVSYKQIGIELTDGQWMTEKCEWKLALLKVDAEDYLPLVNKLALSSLGERNLKILKDRKFCDLELIAEDGTLFPCHKIHLTGILESPVITAIMEVKNTIKEDLKQPYQLALKDLSADGVKALLEFLYCDRLVQPLQSSSIALELLQAGNKYKISRLENVMESILLEKPCKWFDVDTALKMYLFLETYEGGQSPQLKDKFFKILRSKENLQSSSTFQKIFERNPAIAMKLFQEFFDGTK